MREYSCNFNNVAVTSTAAQSMVFLNPAATTSMIEILRAFASQSVNATSAQTNVGFQTQATAFPSVGTATASNKLKNSDPAASLTANATSAAGTCGTIYTTAGAGTKVVLWGENFNNLNGYLWVPTPRETLMFSSGATVGIGLTQGTTGWTTGNWSAGLVFGESG